MKNLIFIIFSIHLVLVYTDSQTLNTNTGLASCYSNISDFPGLQNGTTNRESLISYIPLKTPAFGEYLRIMVIYVKFPDDNLMGDPMNGYGIWWDYNWNRPKNPYTGDYKLIDSAEQNPSIPFMTRYREYTLSDYYSEMSMGDFDVIGDEYPVTLPLTSAQYRQLGYSCSQINAIAIRLADSLYNIDFSRYNNWSLSGSQWIWTPGSGDKTVDMIVMDYRRAPGYPDTLWFINIGIPVSGIADLGLISAFTLDSTKILSNSGVTCLSLMQNYSKLTQIVQHEMMHRFWFNHHEIGLMTGAEHSSFAFSPRERWDIEYVTPSVVTPPYSQQSQIMTLGDFIATGDMLVINLPNVNERFMITNHQKTSVYDGISRGGKTCWKTNRVQQDPYCGDGKGLFIYHEAPQALCNFGKEMIIEQADGMYNWYIDRWVPYFIPGYSFQIPLFERTAGNPFGKGEFHQVIDSVLPSQQEVTDNPCSDKSEDYFVTMDWLGDGLDGFNMAYDEIFSPYSNPRSNKCDGSATGITVKLLSRDNITGAITIKVYYDDNLALQELPPGKPKTLKAGKFIIEPPTGKFHPRLTWDSNIEPDFKGGAVQGHYNIYRGISLTCNPDAEPSYIFLSSVSPDTNEFVDESISLYPYGGGLIICENQFRSLSYKIEAVDNTNMSSLKSDRAIINGYINRCDDSVLVGITNNEVPAEFSIYNYPNPFNPSTQIKYALPVNTIVTIKIYNMLGEEIAAPVNNEFKQAGRYTITFNGTNLASGIYFYKITARQVGSSTGSFTESKKMVLIK